MNGLLDIANRDFNDLPIYILSRIAQCPEIQAKIIVPSLVNELNSADGKKKVAALAALNRLLYIVHQGGALPALVTLLQEGVLDRQLIACIILGSGVIGEQALIKVNFLNYLLKLFDSFSKQALMLKSDKLFVLYLLGEQQNILK